MFFCKSIFEVCLKFSQVKSINFFYHVCLVLCSKRPLPKFLTANVRCQTNMDTSVTRIGNQLIKVFVLCNSLQKCNKVFYFHNKQHKQYTTRMFYKIKNYIVILRGRDTPCDLIVKSVMCGTTLLFLYLQ